MSDYQRDPHPYDEGFWLVGTQSIRQLMERAAAGEDIDLLYAEFYANSTHHYSEEHGYELHSGPGVDPV